uniref:hypothetical protein n=1 Tax=Drosera capensis TaxID=4366 RepID=UPI002410E75C|nr:hypothetical protein P8577_pgp075 [Drosera capensis]WEQ03448.1 hypothetical protein [Drosera capensis]
MTKQDKSRSIWDRKLDRKWESTWSRYWDSHWSSFWESLSDDSYSYSNALICHEYTRNQLEERMDIWLMTEITQDLDQIIENQNLSRYWSEYWYHQSNMHWFDYWHAFYRFYRN